MKVATFGLMALSMATANTLFEEDNWEEVPRHLQNTDEFGNLTGGGNEEPSSVSERSGDDEEETGGRGGRGGRWSRKRKQQRRGRKNKGRGGRKGRGKKGRKGWGKKFDYAEYKEKKTAQIAGMPAKLAKKCDKKPKKIARLCKALGEDVMQEDKCADWGKIANTVCTDNIPCKVASMTNRFECEGQFKAMMGSLKPMYPSDLPAGISAGTVGSCFTAFLEKATECSTESKENFSALVQDAGLEVPSAEVLKAAGEAMKKAMKNKRGRGGRRSRVNNRRSKRWGQDTSSGSTKAEYEKFDDNDF